MRRNKRMIASFMAIAMAMSLQVPMRSSMAEDIATMTDAATMNDSAMDAETAIETEVVNVVDVATETDTEAAVDVQDMLQQEGTGKVGCWQEFDDHGGSASVEITYPDGTMPIDDPEFDAGRELRLALQAPEDADIHGAVFEFEFMSGEGIDSVRVGFNLDEFAEQFPDKIVFGENNNAEVFFTPEEGTTFFCVRVFWTEEEIPSDFDVIWDAMQYVYAYSYNGFDNSRIDYDGDGDTSDADMNDDIKWALASELYGKFFKWDSHGITDDRYIPINRDNEFDPAVTNNNIRVVADMISLENHGLTVEAFDAENNAVSINVWDATVRWAEIGFDDEIGEPIFAESTIPVYILPSVHSILVCTGYDYEVEEGQVYYGREEKYYLRHVFTDRVAFTANGEANENFEDGDKGLVIFDSGEGAIIGGHGSVTTDINNTENCRTVLQDIYPENMVIDSEKYGYEVRIRFMNPETKYISVRSEGETKAYDGLKTNGYSTDSVYEMGENATAVVFVGDTTVYVSPLSINGLENADIKDVRLSDASMADGVLIDKTDMDNVKVEFLSNYYDGVKLTVTYENDEESDIFIERVGLVLRYEILDSRYTTGRLNFDCWGFENEFSGPSYNYDFEAGEQMMVFATYYHPSNYKTLSGDDNLNLVVTFGDGTTQIFSQIDEEHNFNGFAAGAAYGAVDTTTFIIDFVRAQDEQIYKNGLNALVVNGGYDDPNTFGGAQIGNGSGVYWDGHMEIVSY